MNAAALEIVMRSGIEQRAGLTIEQIYSLAFKTLKAKKKIKPNNDWFTQSVKFAMTHIDGILQIVRVNDNSKFEIVEWATKMPIIKLLPN